MQGTKLVSATPDDLLEVAIMSKMFHSEAKKSGYKLSFDLEKFNQVYLEAINSPEYFYLLAKNGDDYVGFFIGVLHQPLFSNDILASEMFWWCNKEARGSGVAVAMLDAFEAWAKVSGATQVNVSDLQNVKSLQLLYKRRGYSISEQTYNKEI